MELLELILVLELEMEPKDVITNIKIDLSSKIITVDYYDYLGNYCSVQIKKNNKNNKNNE